ncbi:MAG: DNA polymerase domain-containing protein [Thermosphaera sp.]
MSETWVLDVSLANDKTVISLYDEKSRTIREKEVLLDFYGYILTDKPSLVAKEIADLDGVSEAWIEKYRAPPYYASTVDVVVFKTKSYRLLKKLQSISMLRGLRTVNNYPHPLVESLYRAGIRPLTRVAGFEKGVPITSEMNPADKDPLIDYAVLTSEHGYYVAETRGERFFFWRPEDVADFIISNNFHLVFSDDSIYANLMEVDSRLNAKVYRWITGGGFHPSEYFEWSRLSYTPLSLMRTISIGRILTTIEALLSRERRLLVDKTYGRKEPWRTIRELIVYDRGGVVYQPKPGLYWRVCQVDFKSLYPNIIVKYNISGETVDNPFCAGKSKLDWTPHTVCMDEEGIVPGSIKKLIELKEVYDELAKKTGKSLYEYRKSAVKWILVASFGYLGYRNSLFGSVMAHEVVTSSSREVMRQARLITERYGYRVVHAIVDSIFIEGVRSEDECRVIKEIIEDSTGFRAKVEAHYVWLYIPRDVSGSRGVANKYYGLLSNNTVKVKGILLVRRDTPVLVKKAQYEALRELSKAVNPDEMVERLYKAYAVINGYIEKLRHGDFEIRDLLITRSPDRGGYINPPQYALEGKPPYRLIYVSGALRSFSERYSKMIDIYKYIKLLEKAKKELPSFVDVNLV